MISLSRVPSWCCCPRLVEVAGVDDRERQWRRARCLPRLSASSWSYHRPTASSRLPQVESTRMWQPRCFSIRWQTPTYCSTMFVAGAVVAEVLVHRRGAGEQPLDVEPHQRRRQQADRREHREPPADAVGHVERLRGSRAPSPGRTACRCVPVTGMTSLAESPGVGPAATPSSRPAECRNAAAVSSVPPLLLMHDDAPARRRGSCSSPLQVEQPWRRRCRRCSPRSRSAAGRAASSAATSL